jgi:hypothetical protein
LVYSDALNQLDLSDNDVESALVNADKYCESSQYPSLRVILIMNESNCRTTTENVIDPDVAALLLNHLIEKEGLA